MTTFFDKFKHNRKFQRLLKEEKEKLDKELAPTERQWNGVKEWLTPTEGRTDCYCVCHNPVSSRGSCEHCHPTPDWERWWDDIVHEVFDEFYPKKEGGTKERSMALAVQAVLATKMIPAISKVIAEAETRAYERGRIDEVRSVDKVIAEAVQGERERIVHAVQTMMKVTSRPEYKEALDALLHDEFLSGLTNPPTK